MRIAERLEIRYKNMKLMKKMLLIYVIFVGLFFAVALLAFELSTDIFEKRLYATSLQELDYYVQSVRTGIEEKSYELALGADVQEVFSSLQEMDPDTLEYSQALTSLRWQLTNDNNFRSVLRTIQYRDIHGSVVESGTASWEISEDFLEEFAENLKDTHGEAVFFGPTEEYRYLLCGRRILKWTDMSLEELGSVIVICDVGQIIEKNKKNLETDHASLFVYSRENMIYQDIEELPELPEYRKGQGYRILKYRGERCFF